jgi:hypothetical protein
MEDFIKINCQGGVIGRICWTNKDFVSGSWGGFSFTWSWGAKQPLLKRM